MEIERQGTAKKDQNRTGSRWIQPEQFFLTGVPAATVRKTTISSKGLYCIDLHPESPRNWVGAPEKPTGTQVLRPSEIPSFYLVNFQKSYEGVRKLFFCGTKAGD